MSVWALSPLLLLLSPTLFGVFTPSHGGEEFLNHVALMWLTVGVGGLMFRTVHLFFIANVQTGLAWMTKIVTDPFHDISLYYTAPLHLMRGEWIDPMHHVQPGSAANDPTTGDGGEADGRPSPARSGV